MARIERLELFKVPPRRLFLKVVTDEGVEGWGEPVVEGRADTVATAVREMSEYVVGADPTKIEDMWQVLYRGGFYRGGPVLMSAISGIEQAMWDIAGKMFGLPVHRMLGGDRGSFSCVSFRAPLCFRRRIEYNAVVHGRAPLRAQTFFTLSPGRKTSMSTHWAGVLAALVTGVSWGVVSPLGRILALRGVDMATVVIVRTFLVAFLLLLWILLKNRSSLRISFQDGLVLLAYSILVIPLTATGFMFSLKYLTVPAALIIHYTFPLVTLLGGLWITGERPTPPQYLAAVLVIAGVWIGVFASGTSSGSFSLLGVFWGVVAVIGLSGQFLMGRVLLSTKRFSSAPMIFYGHLFGGLILAAFKHALSGWGDLEAMNAFDWGAIAVMAVIGSVLGHGAYCLSLKYVSAATASHVCTMEIPSGILLAGIMSSEIPTLQEINGSLLIILAIFLAALPDDFIRRFRRENVALK